MLHLPSIISGLKIAWVKRLFDDSNVGQCNFFMKFVWLHLEEIFSGIVILIKTILVYCR